VLKTLLEGPNGSTVLNTLKRSVLGGIITPSEENFLIHVPAAQSANNAGISLPVVLEGPQDARSEVAHLVGFQGLRVKGIGTISGDGVSPAWTGVGTKFLSQFRQGSTLHVASGNYTILAVQSDTAMTTTVNSGADANVIFAVSVAVNTEVSAKMSVKIEDTAFRRVYMNRPVPVRHVYGNSRKPFFLDETILLEKNQTLIHTFFNPVTSAPGSFCLQNQVTKYQAEAFQRKGVKEMIRGKLARKTWCNPYWLTLDNDTSIAANSSTTQFMTCTRDIFLVLFKAMGHAFTTGVAGNTQEIFSFDLFDAKTGRQLNNQPITLNTGLGDAQNPYWFPHPIILEPYTQLKIVFRNLITDAETIPFVTFSGVAVYTGTAAVTDPDIMRESRRIQDADVPTIIAADVQ
jgi:hypothetical protein